ncbi:MAG: hypothetical protein AAFU85_28290, partial [Planctomycetota bacterium]
FISLENRNLFIIRPWWDRRVAIDLEKGRAVEVTKAIDSACLERERLWSLSQLQKAVASRQEWERDGGRPAYHFLTAAYLAGKNGSREAIPLLSKLQDVEYSGSSVWSSSEYEPEDERDINPSHWEELTARRVVHLSLRRLGVAPGPYDCTKFDSHVERIDKNRPRADFASQARKGMKPRRILELIGAPDFNEADEWYYEIDAKDPYTLTLVWDVDGVKDIQQTRPPIWTTERWDDEL